MNSKERLENTVKKLLMKKINFSFPIDTSVIKYYIKKYLQLYEYDIDKLTLFQTDKIDKDTINLELVKSSDINLIVNYSSNKIKNICIQKLIDYIIREQFNTFNKLFGEKYKTTVAMHASNNNYIKSKSTNFVYGEICYMTLAQILLFILSKKKNTKDLIFYDLGSGSGKAVIGSSLINSFKRCSGIELNLDLFLLSANVLKDFCNSKELQIKNKQFTSSKFYTDNPTELTFKYGDITKENWSDADIIFINSTCFDVSLMKSISDLAEKCKPDTYIISVTKTINSTKYKAVARSICQASWSSASFNICRRID